ncbi:MAG: DegT/DnrJ/EryC1/StrS aminotransferase family protein, partial [Terracidiphilus sp.]
PVFADVDRDSQNMTAETVRAALTEKTKAIVAVHLAGWPCEMDPILELARERGLAVVEDCAQAHGATYRGRAVGSMGDIGAFSFCQDKIMTTAGEGGMVVTNHEPLWREMWAYKDHGKNWDAVHAREHAPGFRWLHESFGTNWRLSEVQSAVGRVQLRKLPRWVRKRQQHAALLDERLGRLPGLRIARPPEWMSHSYYKYYAFVRPEMLRPGWGRERIAARLAAGGVYCGTGSCSEVYLEKAFPPQWRPAGRLRVAQELGETSLMLQVYPTLGREYIERVSTAVEQTLEQATRS